MYNNDQLQAQIAAQIAGASSKTDDRGDDVGAGNHVFALSAYHLKQTESNGVIAVAQWVVMETDNPQAHREGDITELAYFLTQGERWKIEKDATKAKYLVASLTGLDPKDESPANRQKFLEQSTHLMQPSQPGRGILVRCVGKMVEPYLAKRGPNKGQMTKARLEARFFQIPGQPPEQIAKVRAFVDSKVPLPNVQAAPPPQPQPVQQYYAPPPQGYGPPPGTPGYPAPQQPGAPYWPPAGPQYPGYPPQAPGYPAPQYPPAVPPGQPPAPYAAPVQGPPPGGVLLSGLLGRPPGT